MRANVFAGLDPRRFGPHERVEFIVGLGETLYFDGSYGAAASVFESVIAPAGALPSVERNACWTGGRARSIATPGRGLNSSGSRFT